MRMSLRVQSAWIAGLVLCLSLPCQGQDSAMSRLNQIVGGLPDETRLSLANQLSQHQDSALKNVEAVQQTLTAIRNSATASPSTKEAAIALKEEELVNARKRFVTAQAARQIVQGEPTSLPAAALETYSPDVLESITVLSNPMLPTCGATLPYRGEGAQLGWQSTLDKFLSLHGDVLRGIGRIEVETEQYVQGPNNQPRKIGVRTPIGTGFAISGRKVITAGHVAFLAWDFDTSSLRPPIVGMYFNTGAEYPFGCKSPDKDARVVRLGTLSIAKFDPKKTPKDSPIDYAVLELSADEAPLDVTLNLASTPDLPPSSFVIVVEYPDKDGRVDQVLWTAAMSVPVQGGKFPIPSIKRISPGMVLPPCDNASTAHVAHDATTLNRSSGAPIIDAATGDVVAIQVSGYRQTATGQSYCNLGLKSDQPKFAAAP
jgi:hypothetical protein